MCISARTYAGGFYWGLFFCSYVADNLACDLDHKNQNSNHAQVYQEIVWKIVQATNI